MLKVEEVIIITRMFYVLKIFFVNECGGNEASVANFWFLLMKNWFKKSWMVIFFSSRFLGSRFGFGTVIKSITSVCIMVRTRKPTAS